jgi:hypothetical protein
MQTSTEQSNDKLTTSQPAQQSSETLAWLAEALTILAEGLAEPMTPARLKIYIGDLADLERSQLEIAFARARRELKFFPRIAELRELAGQGAIQQADSEVRKAWDVVTKFVDKYVSNDPHGNFGPQFGWYSNYPKLSDRILDTVRRTGGWKVYACMTEEDFPFSQKRFFEEYQAWTAVEHVPDRMLSTQNRPALPEPKRESAPAKPAEAVRIAHVALKKIPAPMTELRDRREMLLQQAQLCRRKYSATPQANAAALLSENRGWFVL